MADDEVMAAMEMEDNEAFEKRVHELVADGCPTRFAEMIAERDMEIQRLRFVNAVIAVFERVYCPARCCTAR